MLALFVLAYALVALLRFRRTLDEPRSGSAA